MLGELSWPERYAQWAWFVFQEWSYEEIQYKEQVDQRDSVATVNWAEEKNDYAENWKTSDFFVEMVKISDLSGFYVISDLSAMKSNLRSQWFYQSQISDFFFWDFDQISGLKNSFHPQDIWGIISDQLVFEG